MLTSKVKDVTQRFFLSLMDLKRSIQTEKDLDKQMNEDPLFTNYRNMRNSIFESPLYYIDLQDMIT